MDDIELKEPIDLFGIECGEGWLPLVEEAQQIIDEWNKNNPTKEDDPVLEPLKFVQVKEKWGELCLYLNYYPEGIFDKIWDLERRSLKICEQCGSDKDVKTAWTHNWIMTLCPECRAKEEKEWNDKMNKIKKI